MLGVLGKQSVLVTPGHLCEVREDVHGVNRTHLHI